MLTDFVSGFLARRALSKREQKQNNVLLFWDKAQRAKKVVNISLPIMSELRIYCLIVNQSIQINFTFLSVSNFWLHERGQEFTRPCSTNPGK